MAGDDCELGSRIECNGNYGTVRFKGEVAGTKGDWLGVEWDNPDRGKHNGLHEGVQYFTTTHATGGSFVRRQKVSVGVSFMMAVRGRYGTSDEGDAGVHTEELYVTGRGQRTMVEMVGAKAVNKKQSKFDELPSVVVRRADISSAGPATTVDEIASSLPRLSELDLSANLLASWVDVAQICGQLLRLVSLNVSDNRLPMMSLADVRAECFSSLQTLHLNQMGYQWDEVLQCCTRMPALQELHVCCNAIHSLQTSVQSLEVLRVLSLQGNTLQGWAQVLLLADLPNLEELVLDHTGISSIHFPSGTHEQHTDCFPTLQVLSLSHNKLHDWQSVNELNKLAMLRDIKLKGNPLTTVTTTTMTQNSEDYTVWYLVIAKIGGLQYCNKTLIEAQDRKGAELDYLRKFGVDWLQSGGHQESPRNHPSSEFTAAHPRYAALLKKYGPPEDSELIVKSTALKGNLIAVTLDIPSMPDAPVINKKVPLSMTVQKLKTLLQRLYKVDIYNMRLSYTSTEMANREIELETDQKEIGYYSVENGDTIHARWH